MGKKISLVIISTLIGIFLVEFLLGYVWVKNHDLPDKSSYKIYNKYYKKVHHLRNFNEWNYKNGLIYTKVNPKTYNPLKKTVLINGDSWAAGLVIKENSITHNELIKIEKKENINIIVSGTSSYSFSPLTAQLDILRNDFNIKPEKIITLVDHTDVGDELCRYKNNIKLNKDGTLNEVTPESLFSKEIYNVTPYLKKVTILLSNDLNLVKLLKYSTLKKKIKKNTVNNINCTFDKIMSPVKDGLTDDEENFLKNVTFRYIDNVFADKKVVKLLLVVHPHKKHFTNDYKFYIGDFFRKVLLNNKYKDKIELLDFNEIFYNVYFDGDKSANYNDIFIKNDAASHLKIKQRVPYIKTAFKKLLD